MTGSFGRGEASSTTLGALCRVAVVALSICLPSGALRIANAEASDAPQEPLKIYRAAKIITMEPALPEARVVAVRDGAIVAVGRDLDDLAAWTERHPFEIDETLSDKVLLPGLIDPHLHPMLGALLLPMEFITPDDWSLPRGTYAGVRDRATYMKRLREVVEDWPDASPAALHLGLSRALARKAAPPGSGCRVRHDSDRRLPTLVPRADLQHAGPGALRHRSRCGASRRAAPGCGSGALPAR